MTLQPMRPGASLTSQSIHCNQLQHNRRADTSHSDGNPRVYSSGNQRGLLLGPTAHLLHKVTSPRLRNVTNLPNTLKSRTGQNEETDYVPNKEMRHNLRKTTKWSREKQSLRWLFWFTCQANYRSSFLCGWSFISFLWSCYILPDTSWSMQFYIGFCAFEGASTSLSLYSLVSVRKDLLLSIPSVGGITYRITVMLGWSWLWGCCWVRSEIHGWLACSQGLRWMWIMPGASSTLFSK